MAAGGAALAVLAKAPIPGFAKTRLIPRLGPDGAAELHAVLLERTLRAAASSRLGSVTLWCAPDRRSPSFEALRGTAALTLRDQPDGDLGARMLAAAEAHLGARDPVIIVGTDCPELAPDHLRGAAAALAEGVDAVIVPAVDGGYAGLGLRRVDRSLFDGVPWGSDRVLAATLDRIERLGWTARVLSPVRDVDVPEDVEWLLGTGMLTSAERARIAPYL